MRKGYIGLLVAAVASMMLAAVVMGAEPGPPTLVYNPLSKVFTATFNAGAQQISLVAQEQIPVQPDSNWPDGWYAFRHNWMVDLDTKQVDDRIDFGVEGLSSWRVWFEAIYVNPQNETVVLYSNVVDVMPNKAAR